LHSARITGHLPTAARSAGRYAQRLWRVGGQDGREEAGNLRAVRRRGRVHSAEPRGASSGAGARGGRRRGEGDVGGEREEGGRERVQREPRAAPRAASERAERPGVRAHQAAALLPQVLHAARPRRRRAPGVPRSGGVERGKWRRRRRLAGESGRGPWWWWAGGGWGEMASGAFGEEGCGVVRWWL